MTKFTSYIHTSFTKLKGKFNGNHLKNYVYNRKMFLMSRAEHQCYDSLLRAVGDTYYVFPQIHLPTIIDGKIRGQNWRGAFRHIDEKSVDFVICDKAYIKPLLAIELDDKTHKREDRVIRDSDVEHIFEGAGLPLLRLENHGHFEPQFLANKIKDILSKNI